LPVCGFPISYEFTQREYPAVIHEEEENEKLVVETRNSKTKRPRDEIVEFEQSHFESHNFPPMSRFHPILYRRNHHPVLLFDVNNHFNDLQLFIFESANFLPSSFLAVKKLVMTPNASDPILYSVTSKAFPSATTLAKRFFSTTPVFCRASL